MKQISYIVFFILFAFFGKAQETTVIVEGKVSYVSSRNVYVKFVTTKNIEIGDTLFLKRNDQLVAALEVHSKSSTSTVCNSLLEEKRKLKDEIFARVPVEVEKPKKKKEKKNIERESEKSIEEEIREDEVVTPEVGSEEKPEEEDPQFKEKIKGRISAAGYSSFNDYKDSYRMRYAFSFRGSHLNNSRFSVENYITFRHTRGEWDEVKENLARALKVYSLAARYDFEKNASLTLGRKINRKISSMGAIDGLQYEKGVGSFLLGAIVGSRPDHSDYNFNTKLFQYGLYVAHESRSKNKYRQSTVGFIEQDNAGNVDRRFLYFQHSGELVKNLHLFGSAELDLYENVDNEINNDVRLTNLTFSLRYRLTRKWRLSVAYDNRKNIIYYESYKSFIDQLIDTEARQGVRFGVTNRPLKFLSWGVNSSLRFQKNEDNLSRNINSYINFSRIPVVKLRASIRANFLHNSYLDSRIFGLRLSKDIIKRKLSGEVYYRMVHYEYSSNGQIVNQDIAGMSLSWRLMKKLTWYNYYEGTFNDNGQKYHRFNTKIIQRF